MSLLGVTNTPPGPLPFSDNQFSNLDLTKSLKMQSGKNVVLQDGSGDVTTKDFAFTVVVAASTLTVGSTKTCTVNNANIADSSIIHATVCVDELTLSGAAPVVFLSGLEMGEVTLNVVNVGSANLTSPIPVKVTIMQ